MLYGLRSIPNSICGSNTLKYVNLSGLSKAFKNPIRHLEKPDTSASTSHSQSTSSIIFKWITLSTLPNLSCLRDLDVSFCGLSQIPDAIGCLHWLERLNLGGNNFVILPSLEELSKLVYLNLQHCKQLKSLPGLPSSPSAMEQGNNHMLNTTILETGLCVFNCPELGDTERCSSMAFSWMIKFIHANQHSTSFKQMAVVIPGSEIPRWFNNQGMGGSTSIDPFPIMHDNNIIGIACCAVFYMAPGDPTTPTDEWISNRLLLTVNDCLELYAASVIIDRKLITVKSNHMYIMYFPRETFFDILSDAYNTPRGHYDVRMHQTFITFHGPPVEVMSIGYHWLFTEDLQPMHCENSLARKCKFLAIEEDKAEEQPQPEPFI